MTTQADGVPAFAEFLVKSLARRPQEVRIRVLEDPQAQVVEVRVAEEDRGRLIGRNGSLAAALRKLVRAAATKRRERWHLRVVR